MGRTFESSFVAVDTCFPLRLLRSFLLYPQTVFSPRGAGLHLEEALLVRWVNALLLCPLHQVPLHGVGVLAVSVVLGLDLAYPAKRRVETDGENVKGNFVSVGTS